MLLLRSVYNKKRFKRNSFGRRPSCHQVLFFFDFATKIPYIRTNLKQEIIHRNELLNVRSLGFVRVEIIDV